MVEKIMSQLFLVSIAFALQVAVMMFGWGLHPQSWWWIIGGGVFGTTIIRVLASQLDKGPKTPGGK